MPTVIPAKDLIFQPESETVEFKTTLPSAKHLAKEMAAFANSQGGTLIAGVREGGTVVGVDDPRHAIQVVQEAASQTSPAVTVESRVVELDGKSIVFAEIAPACHPPILTSGAAVERKGTSVVPLRAETLYEKFMGWKANPQVLWEEFKRVSETVSKMNAQVIAAGSWRVKLRDNVIAGIIGAILSAVVCALW